MHACHICKGTGYSIVCPEPSLEDECRIRERFIRERLARPVKRDELKDLTDFFHQGRAAILQCDACGLLVRDERETPLAETYSEDEYDPSVMEHLYPQYLEAFRAKEDPYRKLLTPGARVLEIGSHYGAFLQTAREWG